MAGASAQQLLAKVSGKRSVNSQILDKYNLDHSILGAVFQEGTNYLLKDKDKNNMLVSESEFKAICRAYNAGKRIFYTLIK